MFEGRQRSDQVEATAERFHVAARGFHMSGLLFFLYLERNAKIFRYVHIDISLYHEWAARAKGQRHIMLPKCHTCVSVRDTTLKSRLEISSLKLFGATLLQKNACVLHKVHVIALPCLCCI